MIKLFRCEICGDPYVGEKSPTECPFCGAHKAYIKEAKDAQVNFDLDLNEKDKANAEHALEVEISNTTFYDCASKETDDEEGKLLFKALKKIEAEHADIWKKVLKLNQIKEGKDTCHTSNKENLEEAHEREDKAIKFYQQAADKATDSRIKQIFIALVQVEEDHLELHEQRLK